MKATWRLRMAAAQREVWTGAQLRRLLAEKAGLQISAASVSALLTKQPTQLKLDTLAAFGEKRARWSIILGLDQYAEQFEVVRIEHDGVIARSHLGAVRAARRHGKAKPLPVLGGLVEIPDHDDGVIDSDDILECHSFGSPA